MSEESFRKVINTLRNNKVTVSVKKDGIYTRLAGNENNGEAFSEEFVNSYPFDNYKSKDQQIKDLEELLLEAEIVIDKRFDGKYLKLKQSYQQKYPKQ